MAFDFKTFGGVLLDLLQEKFAGLTSAQKLALIVSLIETIISHYKAAEAAKTAAGVR